MTELRFQVLWHAFIVVVADADIADALAYVGQGARHELPAVVTVTLAVGPRGPGGYCVTVGGELLTVAVDAPAVVDAVYAHVYTVALDRASRDGWVRVHAAALDTDAGRVLLAGASGVGKTTLALRLLFDGAAVVGDESVVLRDGVAVPVARPFHLKPGVEHHVPEVAPSLPSLPSFTGATTVRAFDPAAAGFPWSIAPAPVAEVIVLERGAPTMLRSVESTTVMHEVVENVFWLRETKVTVVREVASVFRRARCSRLVVGAVADASALLR